MLLRNLYVHILCAAVIRSLDLDHFNQYDFGETIVLLFVREFQNYFR